MIAGRSRRPPDDREDPQRILEDLAASWAPFESGLAWAAWCEQDRASELQEMLGDVRSEQLEVAAFEARHEVDQPAEVIELPTTTRPRRSAA